MLGLVAQGPAQGPAKGLAEEPAEAPPAPAAAKRARHGAVTPMMTQYLAIKRAHPDCVHE